MDEREDITEQHDVDQSQEPGSEGYPEEQPGSAGDEETSSDSDRSGAPRQDEQSRQGGDATGNPDNAG
jgi:hypothetical protein